MAEFTPVCPSGSVSLSRTLGHVQWLSHRSFLNTEESLDDYAKFYYSVEDIISSLVLSAISENEIYNAGYSVEELSKLQIHYFDSYMRSCGLIQYDSNVDQIIRDGVLNCQSFCAPFESAVRRHLSDYITELKRLHCVHKFFAYRKSLAKCDFIKWDSDFDVIFQRLEPEKKWPKIPDSTLRHGLTQHLVLLRELNDDLDRMGPVSVGNMLEGNRLLGAINEEYSQELADMTKQFEERRLKQYLKDMKFNSLLHKRADQARTLGTENIPQDCHLTTKLTRQTPTGEKLLLQLNDRARLAKSWIFENFPKLKGRVGGKYGGPLTRHVPGFALFAASLAALGTKKQD